MSHFGNTNGIEDNEMKIKHRNFICNPKYINRGEVTNLLLYVRWYNFFFLLYAHKMSSKIIDSYYNRKLARNVTFLKVIFTKFQFSKSMMTHFCETKRKRQTHSNRHYPITAQDFNKKITPSKETGKRQDKHFFKTA